jgi:hypothetical protein
VEEIICVFRGGNHLCFSRILWNTMSTQSQSNYSYMAIPFGGTSSQANGHIFYFLVKYIMLVVVHALA